MPAAPTVPVVRGLYVNDFNTIYNSTPAKNALTAWINAKNINNVFLYDLNTACANATGRNLVRAFISSIRGTTNRKVIGVTVSRSSGIDTTVYASRASYNASCTSSNQRLTGINFENEFWNYNGTSPFVSPGSNGQIRFNNSTANDWESWNRAIFEYGNANGLETDFYIGMIRDGKSSPATPPTNQKVSTSSIASNLVSFSDRILLALYITTAQFTGANPLSTILSDLQLLGTASVAAKKVTKVSIILHGGTSYMNSYFAANGFDAAWVIIRNAFNAQSGTWKNGIQLEGYVIYGYQQVKTL